MKFDEAIAKLNEETRTKIKDCQSLEEILKVFSDNGIAMTKEDIEDAIKQKSSELSDDELDKITGGNIIADFIQGIIGHYAKALINEKKEK